MKKLFLFFISLQFLFSFFANADTLICSDRNVGIARSAFVSRAAAESWFPAYIYISDQQIKFGDSRNSWYFTNENVGDDYVNAAVSRRGVLFKFKYKKNKNRLSVKLVQGGAYKNIPPITYKYCESQGTQSASSNLSDKAARDAFFKLSKCNRQYIQQFLRGQGLYKSTIDGQWGAGTASALQKAKTLGKLKGKSSTQIIQELSQNPVCD